MVNDVKTHDLVTVALFTAIVAVCSQVIIPIGPVPMSLATLAVLLSGVVLGPVKGALALMVYLLLGAMGAPVFSAFRGGLPMLAGPTGGFLVGYIPMAFLAGLFYRADSSRRSVLGMLFATIILYAAGTMWFVVSTGQGIVPALMMCVAPFIPTDMVKIFVAMAISRRLGVRRVVFR